MVQIYWVVLGASARTCVVELSPLFVVPSMKQSGINQATSAYGLGSLVFLDNSLGFQKVLHSSSYHIELYYWAIRSRKTCLKRISNLLCLQSHSLIVTGFRCNASSNPSFGSNPSPSRWSTLAPCSGRSPPAKAAPAAKPAPAKCHLRCKPSSLFRVLLRPPNCRSGISEPIIYSLHLHSAASQLCLFTQTDVSYIKLQQKTAYATKSATLTLMLPFSEARKIVLNFSLGWGCPSNSKQLKPCF